MSRDRLRVADYLEHILEATRRIEDYCHGMDQKAFLSNRLVQDAVIRNFEIIGEASRNIERVDPSFLPHTRNSHCLSLTRCVIFFPTATLRLILLWFGERSRRTYQVSESKSLTQWATSRPKRNSQGSQVETHIRHFRDGGGTVGGDGDYRRSNQ